MTSRAKLVPKGDDGGRWASERRESKLLRTIKAPRNFGKRRDVPLDLPSPAYPRKLAQTSPAKIERSAAYPSAAGGAGVAVRIPPSSPVRTPSKRKVST